MYGRTCVIVYVCVSVCGYRTRAFHAEVVQFLPMDGIIMLFSLVASATSGVQIWDLASS